MNEINDSLFQKLMSDPIKRQLILEIINSEKGQIQNDVLKSDNIDSSIRTKQKNNYDSPAALLRQRALKQQNTETTERSNFSDVRISSSTPVSYNKILEGVIAFVEVKNNDQDRSHGVKALMKTLGTDVRDTFSKDVTHVVFKDGSFKTYQKARLMNVHLVSVLWIEACKLNGLKVPENKFPALGLDTYDHNASTICSQLQREYEDIIRDELDKSFASGKPLPSTRDLIIRRKSLMASSTSNKISQEFSLSSDKKKLEITQETKRTLDLTKKTSLSRISSEDDSDVDAIIDGNIISKSRDQIILESFINETCNHSANMEFTNLEKSNDIDNVHSETNLTTSINLYNTKTPKLKQTKSISINTPKSALYRRRTQPISNRTDVNLNDKTPVSTDKSNDALKISLSPLQASDFDHISILSKNICKFSPAISQNRDKQMNEIDEKAKDINIDMSPKSATSVNNFENYDNIHKKPNSINVNKNTIETSSSTNMLSLHVPSKTTEDDTNKTPNIDNLELQHNIIPTKVYTSNKTLNEKSTSTDMSSLHISSETSRDKTDKLNVESCNLQDKISSNVPASIEALEKKGIQLSSNVNTTSLQVPSEKNNGVIKVLSVVLCKPPHKISMAADISDKNNIEKSTSTNMSSLHLSSVINSDNMSMCTIPNTGNCKEISKITSLDNEKYNINNSSCIKSVNSSNDNSKYNDKVDKSHCSTVSEKELNEKSRNIRKLNETESNQNLTNMIPSAITNANTSIYKQNGSDTDESNIFSINSDNSFSPLKPTNLINIFNALNSPSPSKRDRNITRRHKNKNNSSVENPSPEKKTKRYENCDTLVTSDQEKTSKTLCKSNKKNKSSYFESSVNPTPPELKIIEGVKISRINYDQMIQSSVDSSCNSENDLNYKIHNPSLKPTTRFRRRISKNNQEKIDTATEQSSNSDSNSSEKRKQIRKLYNPNESFSRKSTIDDETERDDRRVKPKILKPTGIIIVPDIVQTKSTLILSEKTKNFLEKNNINIENILNKETDVNIDDVPVTTNKKRKKEKLIPIIDYDRDEQKDLAQIILNEQNTESSFKKPTQSINQNIRQSKRLSEKNLIKAHSHTSDDKTPKKVIKKRVIPQTTGTLIRTKSLKRSALVSTSQPNLNISSTPNNRRSTMEFQNNIELNKKRKLKIDKVKESSIVCTKLHNDDVRVFEQIVKKMGGFIIEDEVTDKTTHLVAGEPKRTINMLRAISRGCWILKHEWLLNSLEAGKWLPEEDFEETNFSRAVQQCRLQRQAFGASYSMDIFEDCGQIYVARGSMPRCSDLRELIIRCKGTITSILRNAKIIIGGFVKQQVICVKETWVLDSIQNNKKMKFKKYIITEDNNVVL